MRKAEPVIAAILIVFGAAAMVAASRYPAETRMLPTFYGALLLILSVLLLAASLVRKAPREPAAEPGEPYSRVLLVTGMILAYVISMDLLGFYVSTAVFLLVFMWVMRATPLRTNIVVALSTAFLIYVCFDKILHVQTPRGLLF